MANLTISGIVLPDTNNGSAAQSPQQYTCGGTALTQCQPVYIDPVLKVVLPCNSTDAVHAACIGLTVNAASPGQPVSVLSGGGLNMGSTTLVVDTQYVVSHTTGLLCPLADITTPGDCITYVFFSDLALHAFLNIKAWGIPHP